MIIKNAVRVVLALCIVLGAANMVQAQSATSANKIGWDEAGQAPAVSAAASYNAYIDGATTPTPITGVTCATGVPSTTAACVGNFPALTPGAHTLTLTQTIAGAESAKSSAFPFTYVVVVTPTNVGIR